MDLLRTDTDGVAWLTLNRPEQRNALSIPLMAALEAALDDIGRDASVRVTVIAGAGTAFCAGHDLRELRGLDGEAQAGLFRQCSRLMLAVQALRVPVVARVHGVATAAGCQLVATCDLAVAADSARFATPGVNIGLFCSTPMVALTRAVGRKAAMRMLLTGDMVSAPDALRLGLVSDVAPEALLDDAVWALARRIASRSAPVLELGKAAFHAQAGMEVADAYAFTAEVMARNMAEPDAAEGIGAFLDKRMPVWSRT